MSVKKDASGRRSVQVEVEVPGTPEQVWQAIATGPGVSSWFVPTEGEERVGGTVTAHFGPGMDSVATVTAWDQALRLSLRNGPSKGTPAAHALCEWFTAFLRALTIGTTSSRASNPAGRRSSGFCGCISRTSAASVARGFR